MMLKFIQNKPVLLAGRTLVLADLHIGIEHELFGKGVRVESPMKEMLREVVSIINEHSPENIVLLGDLKHNILSMPPEETRDVSEFLKTISEKVPVIITPGNHDGGIKRLARGMNVAISPPGGIASGHFGFFHGHAWPSEEVLKQKTVIMAHQHPCVELSDSLGGRHILKAWCIGRLSGIRKYPGVKTGAKAIIVPAFNPLIRGVALNRNPKKGILGPLLENKIFKLEQSYVYLLDGTPLGRPYSLWPEASPRFGSD